MGAESSRAGGPVPSIPGAGSPALRGSGGRIRTGDLRVMSPTSYHCSTPRWRGRHRPIVPTAEPPVSSALGRFTTVFGKGTGGPTPRAAPSALSTAALRPLPVVHGRPIHQVISLGPYSLAGWETSSCGGLRT